VKSYRKTTPIPFFNFVTGNSSPSLRDTHDKNLAIPSYHSHRSFRQSLIPSFEETPPKLQLHHICTDIDGNSRLRWRWLPSGSGRTARLWTQGRTDPHLIDLGIQTWASMTEDQICSRRAEGEDQVVEDKEVREGEVVGMSLETIPISSQSPRELRRHQVRCHLQFQNHPAQPKPPLPAPKFPVRLRDQNLHPLITFFLPTSEYPLGR
jgi:hypothetical protein